jgi:hypothetical protein
MNWMINLKMIEIGLFWMVLRENGSLWKFVNFGKECVYLINYMHKKKD